MESHANFAIKVWLNIFGAKIMSYGLDVEKDFVFALKSIGWMTVVGNWELIWGSDSVGFQDQAWIWVRCFRVPKSLKGMNRPGC